MRILLKLSGEVLKGEETHGISSAVCEKLAVGVYALLKEGHEVALVIGGGNYFRGSQSKEIGMDRVAADHVGMLATMMNGLFLQHFFSKKGTRVALFSALSLGNAIRGYSKAEAVAALKRGEMALFVGGTGNPFFTTDSAAALRACELEVDFLLKGTKVDGVYDKDPNVHSDAQRYDSVTYEEAVSQNLRIMDSAAFSLCRNQKIPMCVFSMDLLLRDKPATLDEIQKFGTVIDSVIK